MIRVLTPLRKHQHTLAQSLMYDSDGDKAFWESGCSTGKTLAALESFRRCVEANPEAVPIGLVLTPKSAILDAWESHLNGLVEGIRGVYLVKGSSKKKNEQMLEAYEQTQEDGKPTLVVVNYETAWRLENLGDVGWLWSVADESHKLGSHNSKQSAQLCLNMNHVPFKIAMTATPYEDSPLNIFGQVRWLHGGYRKYKGVISNVLGSWTKFQEKYAILKTKNNIPIPVGYKNIPHLGDSLRALGWVRIPEGAVDLPSVVWREHKIDPPPALMRAYNTLKNDKLLEYMDKELIPSNILEEMLRLHQLSCGIFKPSVTEPAEIISDYRAVYVADLIDSLGGLPTVIFTHFRDDVKLLKQVLTKNSFTVNVLAGGVDELAAWKQGNSQALITNVASGGMGVDLSRAHHAIYYSVGLSNTNYEQSLYRLRRSNQLNDRVYNHLIIARGTIDSDIMKRLKAKGETSDKLGESIESGN